MSEKSSQKSKRYTSTKKFDIRTLTMVIVLVVLWIGFTFLTSKGFTDIGSSFLSSRNLSNLMRAMAVVGIMGSTMVLVIVTNGIDLSAGAMVGFIGCVGASLQVYYGASTATTILLCILISVLIYCVQGSLIAYAGIAPFIVTLGGQLVFKGMMLLVTKGATIAPLKESLLFFGKAYIKPEYGVIIAIVLCAALLLNELKIRKSKKKHGTLSENFVRMLVRWGIFAGCIVIGTIVMNHYKGLPIPVLIMFVLVIVVTIIAEKTSFGRSIYAIGGNLDAAKYSGINVKQKLVMLYMLHGAMIAIAGLILAARLNAGATTSGKDMELDAIAAAVIGGASMSGGIGKVAGAILGALIMETINNGSSLMNLDAYWQYIIKGIILVAAVWFDSYTRARKKA